MRSTHEVMNADAIGRMIERLSLDVAGLRRNGPLSVQQAQMVAISITQMQLQLNELERIDIRENGVSREAAERLVLLDSRLRALRYELYQGLTDRRPPASATGTMTPAAGEDGGDVNDPAG